MTGNWDIETGVAMASFSCRRIEIVWTANSSGNCRLTLYSNFYHELLSYESFHNSESVPSTFSISILDRYGADSLDGLCSAVVTSDFENGSLVKTLGSAGRRRLVILGTQQFVISGAGANDGLFVANYKRITKNGVF